MFIFHGRFQPPHYKHAEIINSINDTVLVVLDAGVKPFSFIKRIKFFKRFINDDASNVIFIPSKSANNKVEAVENVYDAVKEYISPSHSPVVIRGEMDTELENIWWERKGLKTVYYGRGNDISSTEIRNVIFSDKNLSFISNNGCKFNCSYCIWKTHSLKNNIGPKNTDKIKTFLFYLEEKNKKAILSGGGDPAEDKQILELVKEWNNPYLFDIHTSYTNIDHEIVDYVNKIVFHINKNTKLFDIHLKSYRVNIRVSLVLTSDIGKNFMRNVVNEFHDQEICFRELVGNDQPSNKIFKEAKKLEKEFDSVKFVRQSDYNLYYMPDDKIYEHFIF